MNDPEAYNKVMAAERKDNNRSVEEATALEVIGDYGDEKEEISLLGIVMYTREPFE